MTPRESPLTGRAHRDGISSSLARRDPLQASQDVGGSGKKYVKWARHGNKEKRGGVWV